MRVSAVAEPASNPVVAIAEPDYRYGTGVLHLRIEQIDTAQPLVFDKEPWVWVDGMQVTTDGRDIKPRRVLVRARCLPPGILRTLSGG